MYVNSLPPDTDTASACSTESSDGINTFKKCEETREDARSTASSPEDNVKVLIHLVSTLKISCQATVTSTTRIPTIAYNGWYTTFVSLNWK